MNSLDSHLGSFVYFVLNLLDNFCRSRWDSMQKPEKQLLKYKTMQMISRVSNLDVIL